MFSDWMIPFRTVIESTPDGMLVADPQGVLVMLNAKAEEMFGYAKNELVGQSVDVLVPDYARSAHHRRVESYTSAPKIRLIGAVETDLRGRRKDGSEFPCEIGLSPLEGEHGRLIIASVRDISERRALEAETQHAREQAEAASAAKSEFLASMSHELRTPLSSILGFAQLLEDDRVSPLDERQHERLGYVLRAGEHLLHLVDDVLDLSRIEDGRLAVVVTEVDVSSIVAEVTRALAQMAPDRAVSMEPFTGTARARVDRTRLTQILMNFGSNAIKYGRSRITLKIEQRDGTRVSVTDDGDGIAPEQLARIFDPFYRAGQEAGPHEGTGIGLTISRRLAGLMGATIDVASSSAGSTFWIDLR